MELIPGQWYVVSRTIYIYIYLAVYIIHNSKKYCCLKMLKIYHKACHCDRCQDILNGISFYDSLIES